MIGQLQGTSSSKRFVVGQFGEQGQMPREVQVHSLLVTFSEREFVLEVQIERGQFVMETSIE